MLPNCLITKANIMCTEDILGLNLGSLKGKMTRTKLSRVIMNTCNEFPEGMLEKHGDMTLAIDIMYINQIPFVMPMSQAIHFGTAELTKKKNINNNGHKTSK